jgi:UDP-GlcNAc:undecaprenyl-phosphate GlcNAc-1-phosphate transferase
MRRFTRSPWTIGCCCPSGSRLPLTVFFLVGITNAINLADGLDGLAGGTTFPVPGRAGHAFAQQRASRHRRALLAFAGAILGFLRFNTFPASVFMGDAGSQLARVRRRGVEFARHAERHECS